MMTKHESRSKSMFTISLEITLGEKIWDCLIVSGFFEKQKKILLKQSPFIFVLFDLSLIVLFENKSSNRPFSIQEPKAKRKCVRFVTDGFNKMEWIQRNIHDNLSTRSRQYESDSNLNEIVIASNIKMNLAKTLEFLISEIPIPM